MHIHFVCSGNTNRSRMAEAYLRSKNLPGITVSSSGNTAVASDGNGLSKYAERILDQTGLLPYASSARTITTPKDLRNADLVVFMTEKHFEHVKKNLSALPKRYEIWKIGDIPKSFWWWLIPIQPKKLADDYSIFNDIKAHVDALCEKLI